MSNLLLETLLLSSKVDPSESCDATYETLPVAVAESTEDLDTALNKLDAAGGMATSLHGEKIYLHLIPN